MTADPINSIAEALEALEAATRRAEQDSMADLERLLALMTERSVAVRNLTSLLETRSEPPEPAVADRIRRELERGRKLRERLLLLRAAQRAELARLLKGQRAASAVSTGKRRPSRRLDVRG